MRLVLALSLLPLVAACTDTVNGTGAPGNGSGSSDPTGSTSNGDPSTTDNTGSSGRSAIDAAHLCNVAITQCATEAISVSECVANFQAVRVTADCAARIKNATCDDVLDVEQVCFPPCSDANVCNSDGTVTTCSNGHQVTATCSGACTSAGQTYSGTCGTTNPVTGETSTTPQCWCQ
jgi:hypothetical protein